MLPQLINTFNAFCHNSRNGWALFQLAESSMTKCSPTFYLWVRKQVCVKSGGKVLGQHRFLLIQKPIVSHVSKQKGRALMASGIFVFPPRLTPSSKGQAQSDTLFTSLSFIFPQGMGFYENSPSCLSISRGFLLPCFCVKAELVRRWWLAGNRNPLHPVWANGPEANKQKLGTLSNHSQP